jgi:rSAM/selenodomain-associated transferase 1
MLEAQIVVLAKRPQAGRAKTRLCPPLTLQQAADVAGASVRDTFAAVDATPVRRRITVLDGSPDGLVPVGYDVLPQRGAGLDERLAAAFSDVLAAHSLPTLLIGMDTPQVSPDLLVRCVEALLRNDSVLGHAEDGGWWAIGLHAPDAAVFLGVPMSADDTGVRQEQRMRLRRLAPYLLPELRDIDHVDDLDAVAQLLPASSALVGATRALLEPVS